MRDDGGWMKASVLQAASFIGLIKNIINQTSKCACQFIDKTGLAILLYLLFTSIHTNIFLWFIHLPRHSG